MAFREEGGEEETPFIWVALVLSVLPTLLLSSQPIATIREASQDDLKAALKAKT